MYYTYTTHSRLAENNILKLTQIQFFLLRDKLLSLGIKVKVEYSSRWNEKSSEKAIAIACSGYIAFWLVPA